MLDRCKEVYSSSSFLANELVMLLISCDEFYGLQAGRKLVLQMTTPPENRFKGIGTNISE